MRIFPVLAVLGIGMILFRGCVKDETDQRVVTGVLPSDMVNALYMDKEGMCWFGTEAGLVSYNGQKWVTYTPAEGVAGKDIRGLAGQSSAYGSELWVATGEGVSAHHYTLDGITAATVYRRDNSGLACDTVVTVTVDARDVRWFATEKGLSLFAVHDWLSRSLNELRHHKILCMASAFDGWNYMGTQGDGVARYRYDETDGITGASLIDSDWSGLPGDEVLSVFVVNDTCQWFGTSAGAARHTGRDTRRGWEVFTEKEGLIDNVVLSVFTDSRGTVWFGTPRGLSSKKGDKWQDYTREDGLPDNGIHAIGEDREGKIWIATGGGVACYDGVQWTVYKK